MSYTVDINYRSIAMDESVAECLESVAVEDRQHFERTETGRLRCSLTGHEMVAESKAVESYVQTKKYQAKLAQHKLRRFEPHIIPCPDNPSKLLCTLTHRVINRTEAAVWEHMMGRKFTKCLAKVEAARGSNQPEGAPAPAATLGVAPQGGRPERAEAESEREVEPGEVLEEGQGALARNGTAGNALESSDAKKRKTRRKERNRGDDSQLIQQCQSSEGDAEAGSKRRVDGEGNKEGDADGTERPEGCESDSEGEKGSGSEADEPDVDFWMPEPGSRWDYDDGGKRWMQVKKQRS